MFKDRDYLSDLSDEQWRVVSRLLPKWSGKGRKPTDRRWVLDAILYVAVTGCQWRQGVIVRLSLRGMASRRLKIRQRSFHEGTDASWAAAPRQSFDHACDKRQPRSERLSGPPAISVALDQFLEYHKPHISGA